MAIEDLVVMVVGDTALVLATLVLARHTKSLYKATNVLAEIERRRDLRHVLSDRIEFGQRVSRIEPILVTKYLTLGGFGADQSGAEAAADIRGLRRLMPKSRDPEGFDIAPALDDLIYLMDRVFSQGGDTKGVETDVSKQVEFIKGQLRNILLPRWRKELEGLYGE
jgi:hypothetical protein